MKFQNLILFLLVLLAAPSFAQDDVWAAARDGDAARVKALIAGGVDVDAATRYGATALYFAAREGHLELVEWLLKKGASVDVSEGFLRRTPLSESLGGGHHEIAVRLIEHGAVDSDYKTLKRCIDRSLTDVARAIVESRPLLDFEHAAALERARSMGREEIAALLENAEVVDALPVADIDASILATRAGAYRNDSGAGVEVKWTDGVLVLHSDDAEAIALAPLSVRHFRAPSDHETAVYFNGRLGMVEWVEVLRGEETAQYRPYNEDKSEIATSKPVAEPDASEAESSPRGEPLPWPSFRGPHASGVADGQGAPSHCDIESGENVLWSLDVPGLAHSSPVVWGDRVFLTTAISAAGEPETSTEGFFGAHHGDDTAVHTWKTLAIDKNTGEIVWQRDAGKAVPLTGRHLTSSQANSTPATDGKHVVVVFPTAGMVCYDFQGKEVWRKDFGGLNSANYTDASDQWGFASSPIIADGKVFLQADVYEGAFLAAYDVATGRELWKTKRDEVASWSTPLYYDDGEHQEIVVNAPTIRGYDPRDGKELWTLRPNSEQVVPAPIAADGLIYVTTGYPPARPIYAVRPGGKGDLSLSEGATSNEAIAWSVSRGGSYMITPIAYRGVFYLPADGGRLTAYDAATGERIFRARLSDGGNFTASPVASDGRIYLPTGTGVVYVIKAGRSYEEIARMDMNESLTATPAISDGALFVRTRSRLYALGAKAQ